MFDPIILIILYLLVSVCSFWLIPPFSQSYNTIPMITSLRLFRQYTVTMPFETPMVIQKDFKTKQKYFVDIYAHQYRNRILFIKSYINNEYVNHILSTLLYLRDEYPNRDLILYFNVPGGEISSCLTLYDLLAQIKDYCTIKTVNLGSCTGITGLLCGAGTKGYRCAMENSQFLISNSGLNDRFEGQTKDVVLEVEKLKILNEKFQKELARVTGHTIKRIKGDMSRDFYLTSHGAVNYGLIDMVM